MTVTANRLALTDLKLGMKVKMSQLTDILDTCMILLNTTLLPNNDVEGTLAYFGAGDTDEYNNFFNQSLNITPVYFDSAQLEDEIVYDE